MNSTFDLTTLLILAVAVVIFLRLRSVLGRRTGNERPRTPEPYRASEPVARTRDNVIPLPRTDGTAPVADTAAQNIDRRLSGIGIDSKAQAALRDVAGADPTFEAAAFLNGAKSAYEMIVTAFAKGDRETLRNLLSREVYDSFSAVLTEREGRGETTEFSFVGFAASEIIDGHLVDHIAHVSVRFVTDLVTAVRDRTGMVVEGDLKAVRQVTDIWTFTRDTSSSNPNWRLAATDAS